MVGGADYIVSGAKNCHRIDLNEKENMKSYEWNVSTQAFVEVDDPVYDPDGGSADECIYKAGYFVQFSSEDEGAGINLYTTDKKDKPRFYIDIMGQSQGIATLVARDFPALVETLRQIHPLLTLAGLDQFLTARIKDHLDLEQKTRQR